MPPKKISLKITQNYKNCRLDHVLAEWLPTALKQPVSKGKVRKLIVAGAVYLNGKRVRIASKELHLNAQVDVFVDLQRLNSDSTQKDVPFVMTQDRVLFEDEYLIAVDKPAGLPTQPTLDEARDNLFAAVKKFLAARSHLPLPQVYLGLHHRLDRDTSGVILFTKKAEANAGVAEIFASHLATKTYQALTIGKPTPEMKTPWQVKNYLGRAKGGGKKAIYTAVRSGGDFAHTDFRLIEVLNQALWIEAQPKTGRTHQIRVHLAEQKLPILGDPTYGGPRTIGKLDIPRVMLHAVSLTFPHPIHNNKIAIQSLLPGDFKQCLKALQIESIGS